MGKELKNMSDIELTNYYKQLKAKYYSGYMGKKRKELVNKLGFDCKAASHLIRLLKTSIELLTTGEVNVFRHDNQELIAIKNGEWELDRIKKEADNLFKLAAEAFVKSELPNEPDWDKANSLLIEIIEGFWCYQRIKSDDEIFGHPPIMTK